jgi:hypothetical protein
MIMDDLDDVVQNRPKGSKNIIFFVIPSVRILSGFSKHSQITIFKLVLIMFSIFKKKICVKS